MSSYKSAVTFAPYSLPVNELSAPAELTNIGNIYLARIWKHETHVGMTVNMFGCAIILLATIQLTYIYDLCFLNPNSMMKRREYVNLNMGHYI